MSDLPVGQDALAARAALLDRVAAPRLDVDAARARVEGLRAARRRVRRGAALTCAAVVVVLALGWALQDRPDPDQVVADREDTEAPTTTGYPSTTTTPATSVAPPVEASIAPATSQPPAAVTTAPPLTAAPTSTPAPNQVMRVELRAPATAAAGETVSIDVDWVDADHDGDPPAISIDWADPAVSSLDLVPPTRRCDAPGPGGGGLERRSFRYASPGPKQVRVTVRSCGGEGAYAETITATTTLVVTEPRLGDEPARTVVAVAPRAADGTVPPEVLDDAVATVRSPDPLIAPFVRPPRTPALAQYGTSGPATVVVVPASAQGTLQLTWEGSSCVSSAELPAAAVAPVGTVVLARSC